VPGYLLGRRSPLRSERQPTASIAGNAARNGIAVTSLTWNVLNPESLCTILGSQMPRPRARL